MADRKFSQDMAGAWGLMRQKEKVLMILQSILTAILLIFIIIDVGMGMNKGWMLKTELGIVIVLFVLNAQSFFMCCLPWRRWFVLHSSLYKWKNLDKRMWIRYNTW